MDAKEAARAYVASRMEEADELNREIADRERAISTLLTLALEGDPRLPFASLRQTYVPSPFKGAALPPEPDWREFRPPPPGFFGSLMPGAGARRERREAEARAHFEAAKSRHAKRVDDRRSSAAKHEAAEMARKRAVDQRNGELDAIESGLRTNDHKATVEFYGLLLSNSLKDEIDAGSADVGYAPDSRHLVVDLELPPLDVVPEHASCKYVKSGDRIDATARTAAKRGALYAGLVNQVVLKCVDTVFRGGHALSTV